MCALVGYGNAFNRWNSMTEVELYGHQDDNDPPAPGGEDPLVLPVQSVSSSDWQGPNVAANTRDGTVDTRWSAEGDGQWIAYDLGTAQTIGAVKIAWYKGDTRGARFDLEVSGDGDHWAPVYKGYSSGATTALETYTFPEVSARYVRIVGHGNTSNRWNSLAEVELYRADPQSPSDLFDPAFIRATTKNVFDYQLNTMQEEWFTADEHRFWVGSTFYTGVMAAYKVTGDHIYRDGYGGVSSMGGNLVAGLVMLMIIARVKHTSRSPLKSRIRA